MTTRSILSLIAMLAFCGCQPQMLPDSSGLPGAKEPAAQASAAPLHRPKTPAGLPAMARDRANDNDPGDRLAPALHLRTARADIVEIPEEPAAPQAGAPRLHAPLPPLPEAAAPAPSAVEARSFEPPSFPAAAVVALPPGADPLRDQPTFGDSYEIRRGDVLDINVVGIDSLSRSVKVQPDGYITYFFSEEPILAKGRTTTALAREIKAILEKNAVQRAPVTVFLKSAEGNLVWVMGVVSTPGAVRIEGPMRLLEVIAAAGGIRLFTEQRFEDVADLKSAYMCRANRKLDVNFEALFNGDMSQNLWIQPGDFIYIPSVLRVDNKVAVLGEIPSPGVYRYDKDITLIEALSLAGGLPEAAWKRFVYVVHNSVNQPEAILRDVSKIYKGEQKNLQLEPGDVVYVSTTPIVKWNRILENILPTMSAPSQIIGGKEAVRNEFVRMKMITPRP